MDESLPPAPPQGTPGPQQPTAAYPQQPTVAYPQQPTASYPQAAAPGYPQPVPPARRSGVVWIVVGSIVGGLIVLGFTFASGAAVGWFFGSHHAAAWASRCTSARSPAISCRPIGRRTTPASRTGRTQNGQNQQNDAERTA